MASAPPGVPTPTWWWGRRSDTRGAAADNKHLYTNRRRTSPTALGLRSNPMQEGLCQHREVLPNKKCWTRHKQTELEKDPIYSFWGVRHDVQMALGDSYPDWTIVKGSGRGGEGRDDGGCLRSNSSIVVEEGRAEPTEPRASTALPI